ncbi:hypothetical protein HRbin39_00326 [bacterium HR39]|nr:hypothetical protein HRbin39_00326 [bacterium HR39]
MRAARIHILPDSRTGRVRALAVPATSLLLLRLTRP